MVCCLAGLLIQCPDGRLFGCLAGWMDGWTAQIECGISYIQKDAIHQTLHLVRPGPNAQPLTCESQGFTLRVSCQHNRNEYDYMHGIHL